MINSHTNIDGGLSADDLLRERRQGGHILPWQQHTLEPSHTEKHSEVARAEQGLLPLFNPDSE